MTKEEFEAFIKDDDLAASLKALSALAGFENLKDFGAYMTYNHIGYVCYIDGPMRAIKMEIISNEYNAGSKGQTRN